MKNLVAAAFILLGLSLSSLPTQADPLPCPYPGLSDGSYEVALAATGAVQNRLERMAQMENRFVAYLGGRTSPQNP